MQKKDGFPPYMKFAAFVLLSLCFGSAKPAPIPEFRDEILNKEGIRKRKPW